MIKRNYNFMKRFLRNLKPGRTADARQNNYKNHSNLKGNTKIKIDEAKNTIVFSKAVLDSFRENVGKYRPETGGMLASSKDESVIDLCYFDMHSKNTPGTFYYDVESMSEVFREWKSKGYVTNGIYHSHPIGVVKPSYHDVSTALLHLDFFKLDYFYLPIIQPQRDGMYRMYFYVVRREEDDLTVTLEYIVYAMPDGYKYESGSTSSERYSIQDLKAYRYSVDHPVKSREITSQQTPVNNDKPANTYFSKVSSLYPANVLEKVIVCVGTGGARSFLENMARSGFKNFVLIDADIVSPTNIATQSVYISEMGKKKVEVIRDRILDINPDAHVLCVDRFLDNNMSDEEFKSYLDKFRKKSATDYLILGCTDNFEAQKRSSLLALKYGTPYLAAMMYEAGAAAELIFVYPGVTESCPRCLLRDRYEKFESGFVNNVDSSACPIFATERMNALKGYIALMLLMYHEAPNSVFNTMLDEVKSRNFVQIRLNPHLKDTALGIGIFDRVFGPSARYTFMDETLWIPQHPDRPEFGEKPCKLCGGTGNLKELQEKWRLTDTRLIRFDTGNSTLNAEIQDKI